MINKIVLNGFSFWSKIPGPSSGLSTPRGLLLFLPLCRAQRGLHMLVRSMTWNVCDFKRARGNEFPSKEPSSLLNKDYILYTHTQRIHIFYCVVHFLQTAEPYKIITTTRSQSNAFIVPGENVTQTSAADVPRWLHYFFPPDAFARQSRVTPLLRGSVSFARRPHKNNTSFRKSHESEKSTAPRRIWLSPAAAAAAIIPYLRLPRSTGAQVIGTDRWIPV